MAGLARSRKIDLTLFAHAVHSADFPALRVKCFCTHAVHLESESFHGACITKLFQESLRVPVPQRGVQTRPRKSRGGGLITKTGAPIRVFIRTPFCTGENQHCPLLLAVSVRVFPFSAVFTFNHKTVPMSTPNQVGRPSSARSSTKAESMPETDVEKQPDGSIGASIPTAASNVESDPNIVNWDGPDDRENPMNWTTAKKVTAIGIVSFITLLS
jgi:hypothetical protein